MVGFPKDELVNIFGTAGDSFTGTVMFTIHYLRSIHTQWLFQSSIILAHCSRCSIYQRKHMQAIIVFVTPNLICRYISISPVCLDVYYEIPA